MSEHITSAPIFKVLALLFLIAAFIVAGTLASRFEKASRFRKWLEHGHNFHKALVWLAFAIVIVTFGALTIAYELIH